MFDDITCLESSFCLLNPHPKNILKMGSGEADLCQHCRKIANSLAKVRLLTKSNGVLLCRGSKESVGSSGCILRQISWTCIDKWNEKRKKDSMIPLRAGMRDSIITDPDPCVYLVGWNGPSQEGKNWFDIDEVKLQYHWKIGGGTSVIEHFEAYALPGRNVQYGICMGLHGLDDPASKYITARAENPEVHSGETYQRIQEWRTKCQEQHETCPKARMQPLPTRVVDVGTPDGLQDPRIHHTHGENGYYLVLSYCWGGPQPVTLTLDTVRFKSERMDFESLPQTLRDAITVTRNLGIRYIWIDALCIIQDSPEDKTRELVKMAQIYKNGLMTISAGNASTVHDGFLQTRKGPPKELPSVKLPFCSPESTLESGNIILEKQEMYNAHLEPLNRRAWTLQERLLSPQVIMYTSSGLMWQCQTEESGVARKSYDVGSERLEAAFFTGLNSPHIPPSKDMLDNLAGKWIDIVIDYTHRSLSFPGDKLPAMAGIAAEFQKLRGDRYLAGLWEENLLANLMWIVDPSIISDRLRERPQGYRAPSWSWAAIDGIVSFANYSSTKRPNDAEILQCETILGAVELQTGSVVDGFLKIRGQLKEASWAPGTDDLHNLNDLSSGPIGQVYMDAIEDIEETVWCLRVQQYRGLALKRLKSTKFQRVGYFEIRDGDDWAETGFFDSCETEVIVIV